MEFHREMKKENEKSDSKETQRSCKKKERNVFVGEKVFSKKKKRRVNMRRVDRERVNIRTVHTRRGNMKRVKIRRKRNEKHKVKNEED